MRVELTLRRCWLSEVILQGAGIKCQVLIGTCSVPQPELKEVLALVAGRLRSSGNVKVQLGCQVLSLQQDGFEHNQTPGSLCRIKAEPLLCGPAETWQGSQPSYHSSAARHASKQRCLPGAARLFCSHCKGVGGTAPVVGSGLLQAGLGAVGEVEGAEEGSEQRVQNGNPGQRSGAV